jgi:nucleoid-associated protein YgaU
MGLFSFVAEAGEKIADAIGGDETPDVTAKVEVSPERINQLRAENIERTVAQLDIEGETVQVTVNGGTATVSGTAPSQEALEKIVLCAGNQHGIDTVDCQLEVPATAATEATPANEATLYTVQAGDTLSAIAKAHYGDASKYHAIFAANQPMLSDPDKIYVGQSLRIPNL